MYRRLTLFLHSRAGGRLLCFIGMAVIAACSLGGVIAVPEGLPGERAGVGGLILGLTTLLAVITIFRLTNKRFNIMRRESSIGALMAVSFFAAVPWLGASFYDGMPAAPVLLCVSYMLFSTYAGRDSARVVFLMFAIVAALAFVMPQMAWYLPVMLVGCIQMRIFSLRTLLAAGIGTITPAWIAVGLGLTPLSGLPRPVIDFSWLSESETHFDAEVMSLMAFVIILSLVLTGANLYKVMKYNAMTRAMNGFYTFLLIATILFCVVDYNNALLYMPTLLTMASYQATLFFVTRRGDKSCIGIILLSATLWSLFVYNL